MYLFNHEHIDNHFFNAGLSFSHLPSYPLVTSSSSSSTNSSSSSELQLEQWPHLEQGLHNRLQPSSITYRSRRGVMFDWKARDLRKNEETSTTCFTTILPKPHFSTLVVCSPRLATTTCKWLDYWTTSQSSNSAPFPPWWRIWGPSLACRPVFSTPAHPHRRLHYLHLHLLLFCFSGPQSAPHRCSQQLCHWRTKPPPHPWFGYI